MINKKILITLAGVFSVALLVIFLTDGHDEISIVDKNKLYVGSLLYDYRVEVEKKLINKNLIKNEKISVSKTDLDSLHFEIRENGEIVAVATQTQKEGSIMDLKMYYSPVIKENKFVEWDMVCCSNLKSAYCGKCLTIQPTSFNGIDTNN